MPTKSLLDLLRDKLRLLLSADDLFLESVKATERSLFSKVKELLQSFTVQNGKLVSDDNSIMLMGKVRREVKQILKDSTLPKKVDQFLPSFDQVEQLNNQIYGRIVPNAKLPPVGTAKRANIEKVVRGIKDLRGIEPVLEIPLRNQLFQLVETQTQFTSAVDAIRVLIKGTTPSGGELARYARTLATDLLNGFNGFQEQQIARANGLDGFFYTGSLIDTSRQTCIHLSGGTGEYEDLAIRPGLYPVAAIPEIVKRSKDNNGWRPETTADTFAIYRGGYNCRHLLVFVPLTRSERARVERILDEISPIQEFDVRIEPDVDQGPVVDTNAPGGNRQVWEMEKDLVDLDHERGVIFDSTDTKVLHTKEGTKAAVSFTRRDVELMEGRIFTHNHPSWKDRPDERGSSFSIDAVVTQGSRKKSSVSGDIISAYVNGTKEMRAVSKKDTFIFRPEYKGKHWVKSFLGSEVPVLDRRTVRSRRQYLYDFSKIDDVPSWSSRADMRFVYYRDVIRSKVRKGYRRFEKRLKTFQDRLFSLVEEKNKLSKEINGLFDKIEEIGGQEVFRLGKEKNDLIKKIEEEIKELNQERNTFWTHWQMEEIAKEIPGEYIHINETRE